MANDAETTLMLKQAMRHAAISKRKQIEAAARAEASIRLAENTKMLLDELSTDTTKVVSPKPALSLFSGGEPATFQPGDTAVAYVSMGTEVPTLGLLDALTGQKLRVLVPRLGRGRDIGWSEYCGKSGLRAMPRTAAGGLRPEEPEGEVLAPSAIADAKIAFIPAFAIDLDGTRLGRGGGWYDQVLGLCRSNTLKVGVCWDWEFIDRHDAVPCEAHDIPVDAIITPERLIRLH
ncbi:5-formyltetrahydrofolate cyclo-ligase [Bifidobacterium sp. ESL0745]|uniref:5-formyltetrahydrofolate cyclo-ligase n=1 Tax=Bifidobacterium sp. ESL0745 TaxID=2983226 RepID=UPI0023F8FBFA|nr:5-formyltetrahydrofolate cyclo-ligase [Bifidobacterium sp. ESL0745]MDF7665507.1 5-formyltetrahydrofolate cyclo-ligase [Bifidobacterium sp. ESL0745]